MLARPPLGWQPSNPPPCPVSTPWISNADPTSRLKPPPLLALLRAALLPAAALGFATFAAARGIEARTLEPNLQGRMDRPLRYHPDHGDFVIHNGGEFFNRPLYGGNTAFRVDAGDEPEFSLYLPGRGGNLRLGVRLGDGGFWLTQAADITARYRPGMMLYEIRDPRLGAGLVRVQAIALAETEGLIVKIEAADLPAGAELAWAYGGADGVRGVRDGDIGTERVPIGVYFQLTPDRCRDNRFDLAGDRFTLHGARAELVGIVPNSSTMHIANARDWNSLPGLFASARGASPEFPVVAGTTPIPERRPLFLCIQHVSGARGASADLAVYREVSRHRVHSGPVPGVPLEPVFAAARLPGVFDRAYAHFERLRTRVRIETPDPWLDAAVGALNVASDAVWDAPQQDIMHGAIAWRTRLLGWRGPYALDDLGWHRRARSHFEYWAGRQDTAPIPARIPPPDENASLARSEAALHSNGDLSDSHYDMNLVYVDALFRHLDWTGDTALARQLWPVIERHLAWEHRLFRRPFGTDKAPLYEAYADIWASDDLEYDGGGVAYSSAYNAYEERRAADIARLVGADPAPYLAEADAIDRAMHRLLWLPHRGWFAEFKDSLGLQLVHPAAGLWSFYHVVDSGIPTPFESWQMSRYVDTVLPRLPVRGPGVPADQPYAMIATTDWMPYAWSVNNVVVAENAHAALGLWQANRPDDAFRLLKGSLLATMYLGICPGNVGTMTYLDVYRRESQRDFADGSGVLSRAVIEGLFGVTPDLLHNTVRIHPGFPDAWTHASLVHPDLAFSYQRRGDTDSYRIVPHFAKPVSLTLETPARLDRVARVLVNGAPAAWTQVVPSIGCPRIAIRAPVGPAASIEITWSGRPLQVRPPEVVAAPGRTAVVAGFQDMPPAWKDPQQVLAGPPEAGNRLPISTSAAPGHRTLFAQVRQGDFNWWLPVSVLVSAPRRTETRTDWTRTPSPSCHYDMIPLAGLFNARVTDLFQNAYREPRFSGGASLAIPRQGIGGWADGIHATAEIDDSGLRAQAARHRGSFLMPNGFPFATPGPGHAQNVAFVSQWSNYPDSVTVPLQGRARRLVLLMAGSTNWMQSRIENGEVVVAYTDGTRARLPLVNPSNWWPIDQDYFIDDYQFARPGPIPPRVDLRTGTVRLLDPAHFKGLGRKVPGGAANVLELPLDPTRTLKSLTVRALANEVVIGLMSATLERP